VYPFLLEPKCTAELDMTRREEPGISIIASIEERQKRRNQLTRRTGTKDSYT
jgi:hypothetical protein